MSEKIKVKYRIERSEFIGFIEDCDRVDVVNDIVKIYKKNIMMLDRYVMVEL